MTVDIWYPDGGTGSWMMMRTIHPLADIPAEQVAQKVCDLNGWGEAYIAPTSERQETEAYLREDIR